MTHVVIVGAGFAGLAAASGLSKAGVEVTIIDKKLYSTFQPLLYQVATGGLNPGDVAYPVGGFVGRQHWRSRTRYLRGEVASVDAGGQRVKLTDGRDVGYDYLILATGVAAAYFGVEGAAENTFGLYTRADAIVLRDHIMTGYERMSGNGGRDFNIVVVGGGATGVELAGTLGELRGAVLRATFPDVDPRAGARPAGRDGTGPADAVRLTAARLRPPAARRPRRRHPAGHRDQGGAAGQRPPRRRPGAAQRPDRLGGRGRRARRLGRLGAAAGQGRPDPGGGRTCGSAGRTGSSRPGTSR